MAQKHYNISYLEDTAQLLKELKEHSYRPFRHITGGHIADLGCGTGIDAISMAQLLGEAVSVTGLDHDPAMIGKARESAGSIPNVAFLLSETDPLPFQTGALSGVRAERLFQHLPAPEKTIAEINRVTTPGAPLVIVETDWSSLSFYNGGSPAEANIVRYLTEVKVNNGLAAKKLPLYLELGGFRQIRIELYPLVLGTLKEAFSYLWIDRIVKEMAEMNYISAEEQEAFMNDLERRDRAGYFACSINMVIASCIK